MRKKKREREKNVRNERERNEREREGRGVIVDYNYLLSLKSYDTFSWEENSKGKEELFLLMKMRNHSRV